MTIPGSEKTEKTESPFLEPDEKIKEDNSEAREAVDMILGKTPKKEEVPQEEPEKSPEILFATSYIINHGDVGFTPEQVLDRLENIKKDPDSKEEEILNGLLFDGFYEHDFKIGKGNFSLRTISPLGIHRSEKIVKEFLGENEITPFHLRVAMISRSLSYYMGKKTCEFSSQKEFEKEEQMRERVELVVGMPTYVCDAIAESLQAFSNRTQDATRRNLSDF